MLASLVSWIYMGAFCLMTGLLARGIAGRFFILEDSPGRTGITETAVYGFVGITVYAELFSMFCGVGAVCHLLLLAVSVLYVLCVRRARETFLSFLSRGRRLLFSWEGFFLILFILLTAFYTSRGDFHTDTGIYHAQAIRIIEDYGAIRGLANLQLHFGYNSSYLVFCAFFTMRWLTGTALHTTTGFMIALFGCYALHGLCRFPYHRHHGADFMKIVLLIYILTNLTGAMSPATDYGTMYLMLYLFSAFLELAESGQETATRQTAEGMEKIRKTPSGSRKPEGLPEQKRAVMMRLTRFGMLAVLGLFLVSMKLSAAAVFLIALYPLISLLRKSEWKTVLKFCALCALVIAPFLARNVILSGWLFYPVSAIDLFDVEWKVPLSYLLVDSQQITAWGRALNDIDLLELSFGEWLPVWWEEQSHCAKMLICANFLSVPLLLCEWFLLRRDRETHRIRWEIANFLLMLYAGIAIWLLSTPSVRYGLGFLLPLPLLCTGLFLEGIFSAGRQNARGPASPAGPPSPDADPAGDAPAPSRGRTRWPGFLRGCGLILSVLTVLFMCSWIDEYFTDDIVFLRQHLAEPYYISQKPFEDSDMAAVSMGGETVYYSGEGIVNSYYVTPSSCYRFMVERTELIGDSIEEGFRAKEIP